MIANDLLIKVTRVVENSLALLYIYGYLLEGVFGSYSEGVKVLQGN